MRRLSNRLPNLLLSVAALALLAGPAEAGQKIYKKRLGFFETLFGVQDQQPQPPATVFGTGDGGRLTWWQQQQLDRSNGVRVIYGMNGRFAQADSSEPAPLPGLGLGIVQYQPPVVVPIYDSSLANLTTDGPEAEAIHLELTNRAIDIRAVDVERKAVLAFYTANGFKPLWTSGGHATPRALALLKTLSGVAADGMVPKNYLPTGLVSFDNVDQALLGDPSINAHFDIAMSAAVLKYARQMSGGQFEPNRLSLYNDIKPQPVSADAAIRVLAYTPFPDSYLSSLAPPHPQYAVFKAALAKLSGNGQTLDQIADGPDVKLGNSDDRLPAIRARLQTLGVVVVDMPKPDPLLLDKNLSSSLKQFQSTSKIKATGNVDSATLKALNADRSDDERQRLVFNMERLRWLPKNLGTRHVLVNQAAFEVNVFDHDKTVWHSRIIVGKPMNQTYAFSDAIQTVVFNPSWGVPASIIVNEYGPKSRRDPSYLDRNGFKVVDANGDPISSRQVDWYNLGQAPTIGVQQPPGSGNALGELKFLFPNAHDIYMHDTPTKNLFADSTRAYSHGCVRVQNPREFAAVLLGWNQEKVASNIGMVGKSGTGLVESHSINLPEKVPVHLTYFTAWTDENGKIRFFNDIYGRDAAMAKAFAYNQNTGKTNDNMNVVVNGAIIGGDTQN